MSKSRKPTDAEQTLARIVVQVALTSAEHMHGRPIPEIAEWAARQLSDCGFKNAPIGSSWAFLTEVEE